MSAAERSRPVGWDGDTVDLNARFCRVVFAIEHRFAAAVGGAEAGEEAMMDFLCHALRRGLPARFDPEKAPRSGVPSMQEFAWMCGKKFCFNWLRNRRRAAERVRRLAVHAPPPRGRGGRSDEAAELVRFALFRLRGPQREAVRAFVRADGDRTRAAAILGISPDLFSGHLSRARRTLAAYRGVLAPAD